MWGSGDQGEAPRSGVMKQGWFGRQINVLMTNGKSAVGELTEVADKYIVITTNEVETQIMAHAIVAIRLADQGESQSPSENTGVGARASENKRRTKPEAKLGFSDGA